MIKHHLQTFFLATCAGKTVLITALTYFQNVAIKTSKPTSSSLFMWSVFRCFRLCDSSSVRARLLTKAYSISVENTSIIQKAYHTSNARAYDTCCPLAVWNRKKIHNFHNMYPEDISWNMDRVWLELNRLLWRMRRRVFRNKLN